jgi:hypothetical protein
LEQHDWVPHDRGDGLTFDRGDRPRVACPSCIDRGVFGQFEIAADLDDLDEQIPHARLTERPLLAEGSSLPPVEHEHASPEIARVQDRGRLTLRPGGFERGIEHRQQQGVLV